jgi:hypothetical protein
VEQAGTSRNDLEVPRCLATIEVRQGLLDEQRRQPGQAKDRGDGVEGSGPSGSWPWLAGREPHGTDPLGVLSTANIARLVIQANRLEGDPVCRCGQPGPG